VRTVWRRLARLWHRWLRAVDRASREDWEGGEYGPLEAEPEGDELRRAG
jgi:hypothetical protein